MVDKSNVYGYVSGGPTQARTSNTGVFEVNDIVDLLNLEKWSGDFGSYKLITEASFSSSSSVQITTLQESVYDVHFFTLLLTGSHQGHTVFLDMSTNGGTSYITDDFLYATEDVNTVGGYDTDQSNDLYGIQIMGGVDSNIGSATYGYIHHAGDSTSRTTTTFQSFASQGGDQGYFMAEYGGGVRPAADTINAIRFYPNTGTITGSYKLFGLKQE